MNLEEALEKFCGKNPQKHRRNPPGGSRRRKGTAKTNPREPNYSGFEEWAFSELHQFMSYSTIGHHLPAAQTQLKISDFYRDLIKYADIAGIRISKEGISVGEEFGGGLPSDSPAKRLNKARLVKRFLESMASPRFLELFDTLQDSHPDEISRPPRSASATKQRAAFFEALKCGNGYEANRIVGRLREEDHDPGEVDYLEACASFANNRFRDALEFAEKVQLGQIDCQRALNLKLEALAWLGDGERILSEIENLGASSLSIPFRLYIGQLTTLNSDEPFSTFCRLAEALIQDGGEIRSDAVFFRQWNRFTCDLAVRYVEAAEEMNSANAAAEQTQSEESFKEDQDDTKEDDDFLDSLPLRLQQVIYAIQWDPRMASQLQGTSGDDRSPMIVRRVMEGDNEPLDFLQALKTQAKIGEKSDFVRNVASNFEGLSDSVESSPALSEEFWGLVSWAYRDAIILELESDATYLRAKLTESSLNTKIEEMDRESISGKIEQQLTPMGRVAYRAACWDLAAIQEPGHEWRDAGMVSLGFFRILELEYNARLVVPAMDEIEFHEMWDIHKSLPEGSTKQVKRKDAMGRLLRVLQGSKEKNKTPELGSIAFFLDKVQRIGDGSAEGEIKNKLRTAVLGRLTDLGEEALNNGKLVEPISEVPREKFRNPPAHTRFLSPRVAGECRMYVEDALSSLFLNTLG